MVSKNTDISIRELLKEYNAATSSHRKVFCAAPWNSLRIGMDGSVYACNHNSHYILGHYPDQSLMDIWKGKSIKALRKHLKHHDFSLGCGLCGDDILQHRFAQGSFVMFDRFPVKKMPSMLDFRLSNACNLKCIMCSGLSSTAHQSNSKTTVDFGADFLKQLDAFIPHLHTARFIGGEPLAIPVYYDIWERIIDQNPQCNIVIQTNGTIVNERVQRLAATGNVHFSISLDSLQQDVYEQIRIGARFEEVMKNIGYFSENAVARNRDLVLCFCPMRNNYQEIPQFIRFANQHKALICLNRFLYPAKLALWSLSSDEITTIQRSLHSTAEVANTQHQEQNQQFYNDFLSLLGEWQKEAIIREQHIPSEEEKQSLFSTFRKAAELDDSHKEKIDKILCIPDQKKLYFYLKPLLHAYSLKLFFDFLDTADTEKIIDDIATLSI